MLTSLAVQAARSRPTAWAAVPAGVARRWLRAPRSTAGPSHPLAPKRPTLQANRRGFEESAPKPIVKPPATKPAPTVAEPAAALSARSAGSVSTAAIDLRWIKSAHCNELHKIWIPAEYNDKAAAAEVLQSIESTKDLHISNPHVVSKLCRLVGLSGYVVTNPLISTLFYQVLDTQQHTIRFNDLNSILSVLMLLPKSDELCRCLAAALQSTLKAKKLFVDREIFYLIRAMENITGNLPGEQALLRAMTELARTLPLLDKSQSKLQPRHLDLLFLAFSSMKGTNAFESDFIYEVSKILAAFPSPQITEMSSRKMCLSLRLLDSSSRGGKLLLRAYSTLLLSALDAEKINISGKNISNLVLCMKRFTAESPDELLFVGAVTSVLKKIGRKVRFSGNDVAVSLSGMQGMNTSNALVQDLIQSIGDILHRGKKVAAEVFALSSGSVLAQSTDREFDALNLLHIFEGLRVFSGDTQQELHLLKGLHSRLLGHERIELTAGALVELVKGLQLMTGELEIHRQFIAFVGQTLAAQLGSWKLSDPVMVANVCYALRHVSYPCAERDELLQRVATGLSTAIGVQIRPHLSKICAALTTLRSDCEGEWLLLEAVEQLLMADIELQALTAAAEKHTPQYVRKKPADAAAATTSASPAIVIAVGATDAPSTSENVTDELDEELEVLEEAPGAAAAAETEPRPPLTGLTAAEITAICNSLKNLTANSDPERRVIALLASYIHVQVEVPLTSSQVAVIALGLRSLHGNNKQVNSFIHAIQRLFAFNIGCKLKPHDAGKLCSGLQSIGGSSVYERKLIETVAAMLDAAAIHCTSAFFQHALFGLQNMKGKTYGERKLLQAVTKVLEPPVTLAPAAVGFGLYGLQNLTGTSIEEKALLRKIALCLKDNHEVVLDAGQLLDACNGVARLNPLSMSAAAVYKELVALLSRCPRVDLTKAELDVILQRLEMRYPVHRELADAVKKHVTTAADSNEPSRRFVDDDNDPDFTWEELFPDLDKASQP